MSEWKTRVTRIQSPRPSASGDASLILIYPPGAELGKRFVLDKVAFVLGRGSDSDIQIDRDSVSRRHARIFRTDDEWIVEDLGSTNGSYVNDRPIQQAVMKDGDLLKIGPAIFKFLTGANAEAAYHEEIYRMTIVDGLTGVYNKRYFLEFLDREMARCMRYGRPLSLLMFDIDHFKQVNDRYGHLAGDHVLKEIAQRLLPRIRREELLARYGGEEFAAVLPETGRVGGLEFGEQLREIIAKQPFGFDGHSSVVTISIGVATLENEALDAASFIKRADDNLYRAKRSGRNRVVG
ncbi:MAG: GGDEF domain-containing protein [Pseudomonadota bacterium]